MTEVASSPRLRLAILGTPVLESAQGPVLLATRKALALLAYLAVRREPVPRGDLAHLLWPDHPEEQARRSLRQELSRLGQVLGTGTLTRGREEVHFPPESVAVDLWGFWSARSEGRHQEAVALYRGILLQGLHLRDAETFETWLRGAREALERELLDSLSALARSLEAQGRYAEALAVVRRAIASDPLAEEFYMAGMRLAYQAGDRPGALRLFQTLDRELRRELGVPPSATARQLAGEIEAGSPGRPPLPTPSTPFIGRREETVEVSSLLRREDCRLLTIVGPGGVGKTRLALEVARGLQGAASAPDGVYWIELRGPRLVPVLSDVLGLSLYGRGDLKGAIRHRLADQHALLVLDEAEHLDADEAASLEALLEAAPGVRVLTTSRQRLGLRGEWLFHLRGLPVPEIGGRAEESAAAELFLKTAERVRPGFRPGAHDWAEIAAIARLVGGLPLGLELAASWARILTCAEIRQELERSLDLLEGALPHLPLRQRSLRAVIDSMLARLTSEEMKVLTALATFSGGSTAEAARRVADATPARLADLADRALIQRDARGRYAVLELIRQRLMPELPREARDAHAAHYADVLRDREELLKGSSQPLALAEVAVEIENIRGAWAWTLDTDQAETALKMMGGLFLFYELRGWFPEGADAFGRARRISGAGARGRALVRYGRFLFRLGQHLEADAVLEEGLSLARAGGDLDEVAFGLNNLGLVALGLGQPQRARELLRESLDLRRRAGNRWGEANALFNLGLAGMILGEYGGAGKHFQDALDLYRALGDTRGMSLALGGLGSASSATGKYPDALDFFHEALRLAEHLGDPFAVASALLGAGEAEWFQGRPEARARLEGCLKIFREVGDRSGAVRVMLVLAQIAAERQEMESAERLRREALNLAHEAGFRRGEVQAIAQLAHTALASGNRDGARNRLRTALRQAIDLQEAPLILQVMLVACAMLPPERARVAVDYVRAHAAGPHEVRVRAERLREQLPASVTSDGQTNPPADLAEAAALVLRDLDSGEPTMPATTGAGDHQAPVRPRPAAARGRRRD